MSWAYVPAGLLAAMLGGLLTLAHIAGDDPSFAVERDYYRKASDWNAEMAQRAENERLGFRADLTLARLPSGKHALSLELRDRAGAPVSGARVTAVAFHNARAGRHLELDLRPEATAYTAEIPAQRPGLWEFRITALAGSDRFTTVVRRALEEPPR